MVNKLPNFSYLKSRLCYDPTTGNLTWLCAMGTRVAKGDAAGYVTQYGYLHIKVDGKLYYAHRLAWLLFTGVDPHPLQIDHINRDKLDNKITNLRVATNSLNQRNAGLQINNSSGVRGVYQISSGKWQARIRTDKGRINLGSYYTKKDAIKARQTAEAKLWQN